MMRRLALICAGLSLAWTPISLSFSIIALMLGGSVVMPLVVQSLLVNTFNVCMNLVTITISSPGRNPMHYPRRLAAWLRGLRDGRTAAREQERQAVLLDTDPVHRAWHVIVSPPHAITDARRSRLEDMRFRADIATDRLKNSIDTADIDAVVLLNKTVGEVAEAYALSLPLTTSDRARKAIDRRLEETLRQMVVAAETRLHSGNQVVADRFDTVIRHAQASSDRLKGR